MIASVVWSAVTVLAYCACVWLYRRVRTPVLHPVLTATAIVAISLAATHTAYAVYARAAAPLTFLLIPATAALAVPFAREWRAVRRRLPGVIAVIATASIVTVGSAVVLARAAGLDRAIVASFAAKGVTTPVAIAVSDQIGGIAPLAAIFAILSGVIGALVAPIVLRHARAWCAGASIGAVAHGVGTAEIAARDGVATAYSGFAMGASAIATAVVLPLCARFFAIVGVIVLLSSGAARATIVYVPLDDRPVTAQLPALLGRIAGVRIEEPSSELLGRYLRFGAPDAIIAWLNAPGQRRASDYVISSDMLAYGGLVASRIPGPSYADARTRLHEIATLHARSAHPHVSVFATIMRLAPTGVPNAGVARGFFAAYPAWTYLQEYAKLHDPPTASDVPRAAALQSAIGDDLLRAYLATRARNLAVDRTLIAQTQAGQIDRLILGQDDAGPFGLHVREVALLRADAGASQAISIEPGADELGMAMIAARLAAAARWSPRIAVRYSTPLGAQTQDPLEFAPVSEPIARLIAACGARIDDDNPDIVLYVRVPGTTASQDAAFLAAMHADAGAGRAIAVADITFLSNSYASQAHFADAMISDGIATKLDAYASWNTNANTAGTALAEAIAAGSGRRTGGYDAIAHRTFTFMRFLDDVVFHADVRPALNDRLSADGVTDHTLLAPEVARRTQALDDVMLQARAYDLVRRLYPGLHVAALMTSLPWDRTFETRIDAALAPDLPR